MEEIRMSSGENPSEINFWLGKIGTARKVPLDNLGTPASIAAWHIALDTADPNTKRHYGLSVYHLRDVPGLPPARKAHPSSSHEFLMMAVRETPLSDPEIPTSWDAIGPVAHPQVLGFTDEQAEMLCSWIASACVEGELPVPDPGEGARWGKLMMELYQRRVGGQEA